MTRRGRRRAVVALGATALGAAALAVVAGLAGSTPVAAEPDDPSEADDAPEADADAAAAAAVGAARGRDGAPAVLVPRGSTWEVTFATAPRPTRQLAAVALAGLDVAQGRRAAGVAVHGDDATGGAPAAWPLANADGAARAVAPIGRADADAKASKRTRKGRGCDCATTFDQLGAVGDDDRVARVWATTRFAVPAGLDVRVLDVAARYGDGIVVWINGVEVARRRIAQDARPLEMAGIIRGVEWETFHVPVVPGLLRVGDNVVAVEVRPSGRVRAPRLDLEVIGRPAAALVRGPFLQAVGTDRATVVVETDLPVDAVVEWGPTDALGHRVESTARRARRHAIDLTGLPATAPVFYRVIAGGAATPIREFRTLPGPGEVVRIAAYGDVRAGHKTHAELVAAMRAEDPDLVLATGDLVQRGSDEGDWQRFFEVTGELVATVPFWSSPGNHDTGRSGDARRRFGDVFVLPPLVDGAEPRPAWGGWYAFDVGDVHVVMLDSNAYDEPSQLDWLERDLTAAATRKVRATIAVVHDGPYSRGTHGGNQDAVAAFVPVLVKHHTTLLLSGHDHLYQRGRKDGLDYIVTGGGGAALYSIKCGVPGKRACKVDDGMIAVAKEHHYVLLTVYPGFVEACPKHADGTAVEACTRYDLR